MVNQYYWSLTDEFVSHHGIQGQKWGIRRFQNPDGSLTPEGRARLGYDTKKFKDMWGEDIILDKGTKTTRVLKSNGFLTAKWDPKKLDWVDIDPKEGRKLMDKEIDDKEKKYNEKYMSVIQDPKEGLHRGDAFYLSWFGDNGYQYESTYIDEYVAKNPIKVASGEKLFNEIMKEYSDEKLNDVFDRISKEDISNGFFGIGKKENPEGEESIDDRRVEMSLKYTRDRDMKNRINDRLKKQGYDAVMDVNDPDSEMPIIVFDTKKNFKRTSRSLAMDYLKKNEKDLRRLGY